MTGSTPASADTTYASDQRQSVALGHYAHARTLMVEALAEFEQGRKLARPDLLLDPEEWRLSIISRTEELNRVLDPKPRVSRDGVRFRANKLLIRRENQRTPSVPDGALSSNMVGEQGRRSDLRQSRAAAELELEESGRVNVAPSRAVQNEQPSPSRDQQEQAARALSFSEGNVKQAEVLKPAGDAAAGRGSLGTPGAPVRAVPNEEEVVTTKKADGVTGAAKQPSQEDVEAAIERAIQEKIQQERESSPDGGGAGE